MYSVQKRFLGVIHKADFIEALKENYVLFSHGQLKDVTVPSVDNYRGSTTNKQNE